MTSVLPRRRFLTIAASAATMAALAPSARAAAQSTRWRGQALGAAASLRLEGVAPERARPLLVAIQEELTRLERVFSLYRADSALVTLNHDGRLDAPPADLLAVLALCDRLHRATAGAFDPTVQPVFALMARAAVGLPVTDAAFAEALSHVGWDGVRFDATAVTFARPDMALTLNGIAQGVVTDRIAALLAAEGLADIIVDIGEVVARGSGPDGGPWRAGIAAPDGAIVRRLTLRDRALATSAPLGTVLDPSGQVGHIFDPRTGETASGARLVSISAPTAALADGLSTALCVLPKQAAAAAIQTFPKARLETRL